MPRRMLALHNTTTKDTTEGEALMFRMIRTAEAYFHFYKKQLRVSEFTVNTLAPSLPVFIVEC